MFSCGKRLPIHSTEVVKLYPRTTAGWKSKFSWIWRSECETPKEINCANILSFCDNISKSFSFATWNVIWVNLQPYDATHSNSSCVLSSLRHTCQTVGKGSFCDNWTPHSHYILIISLWNLCNLQHLHWYQTISFFTDASQFEPSSGVAWKICHQFRAMCSVDEHI